MNDYMWNIVQKFAGLLKLATRVLEEGRSQMTDQCQVASVKLSMYHFANGRCNELL